MQSLHDGMLEGSDGCIGRMRRGRRSGPYQEAGCANLSLDLMWGLPGQTLEQWLDDVRARQSRILEKPNMFPRMG